MLPAYKEAVRVGRWREWPPQEIVELFVQRSARQAALPVG